MNKDAVIDRLKNILIDELFVEVPKDEIQLDDGFQTVLGLDSVSFLELRLHCEREFGIDVSEEDFSSNNFSSLHNLSTFIESQKNETERSCKPHG